MSDFDSWFKKNFRDLHDAILCGDLIAGNYKKVSKKSYEAGQQSKQKEIDSLLKRVKELELINFDSELHFDAAKEEIIRLKDGLEIILKSYQAQSGLTMSDEFNRGWFKL